VKYMYVTAVGRKLNIGSILRNLLHPELF